MTDRPGGLLEVAEALGGANINVEYGYAYSDNNNASFFFRVDDTGSAISVLRKAGIKLLKEKDI